MLVDPKNWPRLKREQIGEAGLVRLVLRETLSALKYWPDTKQWMTALRLAIPGLTIVAFIGFLAGWVTWYPMDRWQDIVKAALIAFFVSAIPTELIFRGLALSIFVTWTPRWGAWLSTIAFALFYPIYGSVFMTKWNEAFTAISFCFAMFIFGIILSHIRIVSRSLWPVILIHGFAAFIWLTFLGRRFY